jgi:hypothetical protein
MQSTYKVYVIESAVQYPGIGLQYSSWLDLQHSWLRHYTTSGKVADSIQMRLLDFFNLPILFSWGCLSL